jgi:hypothetical protein
MLSVIYNPTFRGLDSVSFFSGYSLSWTRKIEQASSSDTSNNSRRQRLPPSIEPNCEGSTGRRGENPVIEIYIFNKKNITADNVHNCDDYVNMPSSRTLNFEALLLERSVYSEISFGILNI